MVALNDKSTDDHPSENLRGLRDHLLGTGIKLMTGPHAMEEIVTRDEVDTVVAAVVGAAGLAPVIAAAKAGKTIALANKEALVVAGSIVMPTAHKHGATIIPVDSEHSAIFQSLRSGTEKEIRKIVLTASGGPVPHVAEAENRKCHRGGSAGPSELEDGSENHDRFRHNDEQGAGDH